jgi:HEAT repeat protein
MIGSSRASFRHRFCFSAGFCALLLWSSDVRAQELVDLAGIRAKLAESRLQKLGEEDLRRQLSGVREVGLTPAHMAAVLQAFPIAFAAAAKQTGGVDFDPKPLVRACPETAGLPLRSGTACRLDAASAGTLQQLSRKLRIYLALGAPKGLDDKRDDPLGLETALRKEKRGQAPEWLRPEAIPSLLQLLMHEDQAVRRLLIGMLEEIPGQTASVALAQRAVFDLAPEMRAAAIEALASRPYGDYRHVLMEGFRYPWPPAAEHAAEALAALGDKKAVPHLVTLLREPDPGAPSGSDPGKSLIREVVKTNHLMNCLLCHPPAISYGDPVVGVIPGIWWQAPTTLTQSQVNSLTSSVTGAGSHNYPPPPSSGGYGNSGGGNSGGSGGGQAIAVLARTGRSVSIIQRPPQRQVRMIRLPVLVRADVTYLRQDFSLQQPVIFAPGAPPLDMRFDYLIATRPMTPDERKRRAEEPPQDSYPQRDAVLYALRQLTGKDPGNRTWDWELLYPNAARDAEAERLLTVLLDLPAGKREALLARYKTAREPAYAVALAAAMPKLTPAERTKARAALKAHMGRLSAKELRECIADPDPETHRAAALVCTEKTDREYVPDWIACLKDSDQSIARAAHLTLIRITGQNLGPPPNPDAEAYAAAATRWAEWWQEKNKK